jgi:hypothetical protein
MIIVKKLSRQSSFYVFNPLILFQAFVAVDVEKLEDVVQSFLKKREDDKNLTNLFIDFYELTKLSELERFSLFFVLFRVFKKF